MVGFLLFQTVFVYIFVHHVFDGGLLGHVARKRAESSCLRATRPHASLGVFRSRASARPSLTFALVFHSFQIQGTAQAYFGFFFFLPTRFSSFPSETT